MRYLADEETRAKKWNLIASKGPSFLLQAVPLLPPISDWDVTGSDIENALRHGARGALRNRYGLAFVTGSRPEIMLRGLQARDTRTDAWWVSEVHRRGYIGAAIRLWSGVENGDTKIELQNVIYASHCEAFEFFGRLCDDLVTASQTDVPYVLRGIVIKARGLRFEYGDRFRGDTDPYREPEIEFPATYRGAGESFTRATSRWCELLYNAFGMRSPKTD